MKSPVHVRCARSGELCDECKRKLDSGEITELDVKLTGVLSTIEEKNKLDGIVFIKSIKLDSIVFILVGSKPSDLIGRSGKILKEIKRAIDAKVRIVDARTEESIVRDMLYPVKYKYISRVFKPDGTVLKIVIPKSSTSKLFTKKETIEKALAHILGLSVEIREE